MGSGTFWKTVVSTTANCHIPQQHPETFQSFGVTELLAAGGSHDTQSKRGAGVVKQLTCI